MSKKSNKWKNGMQSISLLKATLPWRSTDAIMISAEHRHYDHAGYCDTLRTLGKLRQNVGNRMVLTYNDAGHTPKCPQIGVLLNNRAAKLAAFLLYKWDVFTKFRAKLPAGRTDWRAFQLAFICTVVVDVESLEDLCGRKKGQLCSAIAFGSSLGALQRRIHVNLSWSPQEQRIFEETLSD